MSNRKKDKSVGSRTSGKNTNEVILPVDIHPLAISQARAFANLSRSISIGIQDGGNDGEMLAFLVNAGLSIELYLKALMILARFGRVTKEHDLDELYRDFPDFLRHFLEFTYTSRRPVEGWEFSIHAMKFGRAHSKVPAAHARPQFQTFADTLSTIKDTFLHSRYFFAWVNSSDWSVFTYAPVPIDAVMWALDAAYEHLLAGSFAVGKDMIAERNL